jgi:hypothetical protein
LFALLLFVSFSLPACDSGDSSDADGDNNELYSTDCPEEPLNGMLSYHKSVTDCDFAVDLELADDLSYTLSVDAFYIEGYDCFENAKSPISMTGKMQQELIESIKSKIEEGFADAPATCLLLLNSKTRTCVAGGGGDFPFRAKFSAIEYYFAPAYCPPDAVYPEWIDIAQSAVGEASVMIYNWAIDEARAHATPLVEGDACPQANSMCGEGLKCSTRNRVCEVVE